jgi:hypothetical protein
MTLVAMRILPTEHNEGSDPIDTLTLNEFVRRRIAVRLCCAQQEQK